MSINKAESSVILKESGRDYLFDNMRAVLIILVVWGHVLTSMMYKSDPIKSLYYFVFFFHMPAMAYVSGYFSKNLEKSRKTAVEVILLPYLILNVCNYLYKMFIIQESYFSFRFFRPLWGLWYLLALFLWKYFLKDLVRIRFILPISLIVGILSGFSKEFSNYMALGRVICFLPFFLLGYYSTRDHVDKIKRIPKWIFIGVVGAVVALSAFIVDQDIFKVEVLYLRKAYPEATELKHMIFRTLVYVIAILMIVAMINLISNKKSFLSKIGASTLTVYILHLFTIPLLEKLEILKNQPYIYLIYSILVTAMIVYVYSRPLTIRIYDAIFENLVKLIIRTKESDN